jgi:pimeloyl-ACP methyl ester carboxylesterase
MPWIETAEQLARARAERPVVIPTTLGALYGIFTPADPAAPPAGRCVVLFTRPRSHRNRMWVETARALAVEGFPCFRFDYHGQGDSEGEGGFLNPNEPYRDDAVAVLRYLREQLGQERFVLYGGCFDARTAFSAFLDAADSIDGMVFSSAPVMDLDTVEKVYAERRSWRQVIFGVLDRRQWKSLLRPGRLRQVLAVLFRMARRSTVGSREEDFPLSPSFLQHFDAFLRSRARLLFLYGRADREYDSFRTVERSLLPRLDPAIRRRIDVQIWDGPVHGASQQVPLQRSILDTVQGWIREFHPMLAGKPRSGPAPATR